MATKNQVAKRYQAAGVMAPSMKLEGESLQHHIGRKAATFADKRTKRNRTRGAQHRSALRDWS